MSGTGTQIQIQLPPPEVPLTDSRGRLTKEWRYVWIALVQRTGGSGGSSSDALQKEIDALNGEVADLGILAGADMVAYPNAPSPDQLTAAVAMPPQDVTPFAPASFSTIRASGLITPTSAIGIAGTSTNDNVQAGSVGEYIASTLPSGSALALTTITPANICTVALSAGDWDVSATGLFKGAAATNVLWVQVGVSTASATLSSAPGALNTTFMYAGNTPFANVTEISFNVARFRFSLAGATTIYLISNASFSAGALSGYGTLTARRVR